MQAVRSELSDRLSSTGREYHSREDLNELPLTMALWKEALRLHPVAIGVMRETGEVSNPPAHLDCQSDESRRGGRWGVGASRSCHTHAVSGPGVRVRSLCGMSV